MILPILSGRFAVEHAERLQARYGDAAATAAVQKAGAARGQDNAVMYCRWREVERLCRLPDRLPEGATLN